MEYFAIQPFMINRNAKNSPGETLPAQTVLARLPFLNKFFFSSATGCGTRDLRFPPNYSSIANAKKRGNFII